MRKPKDLPRIELMTLAMETLSRHANAKVYFKFTCAHCGERCTLSDANQLYERGECFKCGEETEIKQGGFLLVLQDMQPNRCDCLCPECSERCIGFRVHLEQKGSPDQHDCPRGHTWHNSQEKIQ